MARRLPARESLVKLIVGAGQASPSPPVGPALGSKGVKSIDFCKEFNALTAHINPGTPIPSLITVRPDRSFYFTLRTPPTATLLLTAAGVGASKGGKLRGANAPGRAPALPTTPTLAQSLSPEAGGAVTPHTRPGKGQSASASGGKGIGRGVAVDVARTAGGDRGPGHGGGTAQVGEISLKHVYEIARIKGTEERLKGLELEGLVRSVVAQARGIGVGIVP